MTTSFIDDLALHSIDLLKNNDSEIKTFLKNQSSLPENKQTFAHDLRESIENKLADHFKKNKTQFITKDGDAYTPEFIDALKNKIENPLKNIVRAEYKRRERQKLRKAREGQKKKKETEFKIQKAEFEIRLYGK